jgi:hypothetical protein
MSKSKILVIAILVLLSIGITYALINSRTIKEFVETFNPSPEFKEKETAYKNQSGDKVLSDEIEYKYKNDAEGKYIFQLGWGVVSVDDIRNWDYRATPFGAKIVSINKTAKTFVVEFTKPISMPRLGQQQELKFPECNEKNTYINDGQTTSTDKVFADSINKNDEIISFCLNNACTEIGKLCKALVKTQSPFGL